MCAAMEGLAAAMEPKERSIGWVTSATYDLADKVFREITYIAARKLQHHVLAIRDGERRVLLRNIGGGTSEIRAKSADNAVRMAFIWSACVAITGWCTRTAVFMGNSSCRAYDCRGLRPVETFLSMMA